MIIDITVKKYKSITKEAKLNFTITEKENKRISQSLKTGFAKSCLRPVVPVAGIFGENGSGKTTLIASMLDIKNLCYVEKWKGNANAEETETEVSIAVILEGVLYDLNVIFTSTHIKSVTGYKKIPRGKDKPYKENSDSIRRDLSQVMDSIIVLNAKPNRLIDPFGNLMDDEEEKMLMLLKRFGSSISGFHYENYNPCVTYTHTDGSSIVVPYNEISDGERFLIYACKGIVRALDSGKTIILDGQLSSLHSLVATEIIKIFSCEATNRKSAQLIFTSHNHSLMDKLERDEVFFVTKTPEDGTTVMGLSEFIKDKFDKKFKKSELYASGRFGAVPFISGYDLWFE